MGGYSSPSQSIISPDAILSLRNIALSSHRMHGNGSPHREQSMSGTYCPNILSLTGISGSTSLRALRVNREDRKEKGRTMTIIHYADGLS